MNGQLARRRQPFMETEIHNYIITQILKNQKRVIKLDQAIISTGIIDSFSLVDLASFIQDTYGVEIADSELNAETFDSIAQLVELIKSRQTA
jgi:acyl carrier protein